MIASGSHNQFQSSLAPLGDFLKALMFLSNLNGFNSPPSPPVQGFNQRKGSSKVWKEKGSKWFYHFLLSLFVFVFTQFVCFAFILSQSNFYALLCLTCFCLFFFQFCLFCFSYKIIFFLKNQKKKYKKQCVLYVHWYLCTLDGHWNKIFRTLYLL